MPEQIHEIGDVVRIEGQEYEVTNVSNHENEDQEKSKFAYTFRLKSDLEAERKAEEDRLAEEQRQQELTEQADAEPEPVLPQPGEVIQPTREVDGWGGSPDVPPSEPLTERKAPDDYAS